jgi:8-oxo-dGTP pyrophosphatase MutT (NUDIX family)
MSDSPPSPHQDLEDLRARLNRYGGPQDDPSPRPGGWLASVAVVLRPDPSGRELELLLIRRSRSEADPWSGHMALPGGRKDRQDPSLLSTATRETLEEVGVSLERTGEPLGNLEIVQPISADLPLFTVLPFVFQVPTPTMARVASEEVAEIRWISLSHLRAKRNQTLFIYRKNNVGFRFPAIDVGGHPVWGLTHRILSDLFRRLDPGAAEARDGGHGGGLPPGNPR